ncbi:MAG: hypothetical protein AB1546_13280 [bacterium]
MSETVDGRSKMISNHFPSTVYHIPKLQMNSSPIVIIFFDSIDKQLKSHSMISGDFSLMGSWTGSKIILVSVYTVCDQWSRIEKHGLEEGR